MQERYALKQVTENDIDNLFMEVERITELYLHATAKESTWIALWPPPRMNWGF